MNMTIRVARGLAWIDEYGTEFDVDLNRVDLDRLDMTHSDWCVLGQAYRATDNDDSRMSNYARFMRNVLSLRSFDDQEAWAYTHGFLAKGVLGDTYTDLDELWVTVIGLRRGCLLPCGCPSRVVDDEGHQAGCSLTVA